MLFIAALGTGVGNFRAFLEYFHNVILACPTVPKYRWGCYTEQGCRHFLGGVPRLR